MDKEQFTSTPPLSLKPPPKRILADAVTERLRDAILNGSFKPGQLLREEQLATMLDLSRGPVREALIRLEREGLVQVRRHRGTIVAQLSRSDVEEVYSLRVALERLAVQNTVRHATEEDFAAMEQVIAALDTALAHNPSEHEIARLDLQFHDIIYRAARHQRLYDCWANLRSQIYIFLLSRNIANPDFRKVTLKGHADILDILRARDEAGAIQVIEDHLRAAYERIIQEYNQTTDQ
jgi:DNA-binding GntR family transcriptional regulator